MEARRVAQVFQYDKRLVKGTKDPWDKMVIRLMGRRSLPAVPCKQQGGTNCRN